MLCVPNLRTRGLNPSSNEGCELELGDLKLVTCDYPSASTSVIAWLMRLPHKRYWLFAKFDGSSTRDCPTLAGSLQKVYSVVTGSLLRASSGLTTATLVSSGSEVIASASPS